MRVFLRGGRSFVELSGQTFDFDRYLRQGVLQTIQPGDDLGDIPVFFAPSAITRNLARGPVLADMVGPTPVPVHKVVNALGRWPFGVKIGRVFGRIHDLSLRCLGRA